MAAGRRLKPPNSKEFDEMTGEWMTTSNFYYPGTQLLIREHTLN